jgi:hypothetical protein
MALTPVATQSLQEEMTEVSSGVTASRGMLASQTTVLTKNAFRLARTPVPAIVVKPQKCRESSSTPISLPI